ncbi:flagellar basal-body MS-ring/collar protein FliF [Allosphingosinicella vermicomposti]|uniref:flagellar basal-body MS-ring/collar protein FliF n=1 Tax=Allosphingosinicella vermicomposti TaxID=614671 RepID=UPI000D0F38B4|nr:flagellar basal-body MS-ring/collar protein FliF [Allosphingosinicella vermicomposti]
MSDIAATSNDVIAASARSVAPSTPRAGGTGAILESIQVFTRQPAVAKSLPAIGFLALMGLAALLWMTFSAPPSRDLFQGLPDADKAAVAEALSGAGIQYSIDRTTGALSVSENDYHQAKMLLAQQGLPKAAPGGDELITNLPLGSSRAVEGERLRSARELDLARTIEAIDAVQQARVHLAVAQQSVFLRDKADPAASVMLTLAAGRALSDAQVQAIVHLVASSVPGLAPDGVSVVDQNGRLLSGAGGNGAVAESERQVEVQDKIENRYREALTALLTPIVGAGNFTAEVHADMDFSQKEATREGFPEEARALRSEEGSTSSDGTGAAGPAAAGGVPGAIANEAPPAAVAAPAPGVQEAGAEAAAGAANQRRTENYSRNFAVGREVSHTKEQTGQVKRLSVAVALKTPEGGKPLSPQDLAAIENLVKGAVGFDQQRGDVVALTSRAFAPVETATESWWEASWVSMLARNLTALGLAALLIFGVGRPLLKKGSAVLANRAASSGAIGGGKGNLGDEISAALSAEARENAGTKVTLEMIEAAKTYEARAELVRNFVRQDPTRAALVVRDLIRSDSKGADKNG